MKNSRSILWLVLFIVSFNTVIASVGDGSLKDTNIQYIGRWDKSNATVFHSYWGGAYFKVSFTGKTVQIKLASAVNIYVSIDGKEDVKYTEANGIVNLTLTDLEGETHTLRVAANYTGDEIQFQGLLLDKGGKTLKQPKKGIIEFIGNSITSGQTTTKNNLSSFAWLTGESLDVDHTQISQPGITLVDGYRYDANWAPKHGQSVQYFLLKQPNNEENPSWNFKTYTPKLIVINLGTNDHNLRVPNDVFQKTYVDFLANVRSKFPSCEILVLQTFGGFYTEETETAVKQHIDKGETKMHYISTEGWVSKDVDLPDGTHPNDEGHVKIAKKLKIILREYLVK